MERRADEDAQNAPGGGYARAVLGEQSGRKAFRAGRRREDLEPGDDQEGQHGATETVKRRDEELAFPGGTTD
jgi:hypothetical protein